MIEINVYSCHITLQYDLRVLQGPKQNELKYEAFRKNPLEKKIYQAYSIIDSI